MQKLQDFLIMMTLTDCIEPPVFQDKLEHQLALIAAISFWLNILALIASFWQDLWLPAGQFISPMTILLLVNLLIISWLTRRYFKQHFPTHVTPLRNMTEVAYRRRQVLRRLSFDSLTFLIIFLGLWGRVYFEQSNLGMIFWQSLVWVIFWVSIGMIFKYNKLMARYTKPKKP